MQEQLSSVDRSLPWTRVQRLLCGLPLDELQVFWTWAVDQGGDGFVLEPDWAAQYHSPASWAASGRRKAPAGTSRGTEHVIRTGLGDMRQALQLSSFFWRSWTCRSGMPYLQYGPRRSWGRPYMPGNTGSCGLSPCSLERLSLCSGPLCEACLLTCVNELRSGKLPFLRWPDRRLAVCFTEGLRTIGCVRFRRQFSGRCSCAFCVWSQNSSARRRCKGLPIRADG